MSSYKLSLSEASNRIRLGQLSPSELLETQLNRIDQFETYVKAWVTVYNDKARSEAKKLTEEAEEGHIRGPLHGIPVGVKDIYYTAGLRTTMGSPIFRDFIPSYDAATIVLLKEAGAIILGKTETTEFASKDPAPTRNPWNLEHTPGGSSSGSAVAVSTGMCLSALGSQTGGSVIRPAAYCGVVGMKPTYDLISRYGVYPLSWSMDHVGFFTRTVDDAAIVLDVLSGNRLSIFEKSHSREAHPRIGMLRDYFHEYADEEAWTGFEKAVEHLKDTGAEVVEIPLPKSFSFVHAAHRLIVTSEAASVHEENFRDKMSEYRDNIRGTIASGMLVPASSYIRAKRLRGRFIRETLTLLKNFDCIVTPSASTPAPKGLEYTGDPAFNAPWSFCGFPAITLPSKITEEGLPLGIQLIDSPCNETHLIEVARWCERIFCFPNEPKDPDFSFI